MTIETECRQAIVDSARVTLIAVCRYVLTCQWERCIVVIEIRVPVRRRVTSLARRRELGRFVVRIISAVVISQVAINARGRQTVILPARVTLIARRRDMLPRQRERCVVMVEVRIPVRSRVASLARRRELCGLMVWF